MVVSLAGCGGKGGDGMDGSGGGANQDGASGGSVAMGRYVETMTDVDTGELLDLKELADGRLILLENGAEGRWVSEDKGATWKPDALPGWNDLAMDYYIYDMKAAPDGSVAILCKNFGTMSGDEDDGESDDGAENKICLIPAQGDMRWFDVPTDEHEIAFCGVAGAEDL